MLLSLHNLFIFLCKQNNSISFSWIVKMIVHKLQQQLWASSAWRNMFWCHDCVQSHIWMMMDGMGLGWNPVLRWVPTLCSAVEFGWVQRASFSWSSWTIHWAPLQRSQWAASAWQNQSMPPLQEEMGSSIWKIVKSKFMPRPGIEPGTFRSSV